MIVITRRPEGYTIEHVEGKQAPLINGLRLGKHPQGLVHGDVINVTGTQMMFNVVSEIGVTKFVEG